MASLFERGLLVAAEPLRDVDGRGMTVTRFASLGAAEHAATREDPSVVGGLLAVHVRPRSVVMTVVPDTPTTERHPTGSPSAGTRDADARASVVSIPAGLRTAGRRVGEDGQAVGAAKPM